jgi:hypothetical protein
VPFTDAGCQQNKNKNNENKQRYDYSGNFLNIICPEVEYSGIKNNKQ